MPTKRYGSVGDDRPLGWRLAVVEMLLSHDCLCIAKERLSQPRMAALHMMSVQPMLALPILLSDLGLVDGEFDAVDIVGDARFSRH